MSKSVAAGMVGNATKIINEFTGTGSQTVFILSVLTGENLTDVFVDGIHQPKDSYSISGLNLTFSEAPLLTAKIEVTIWKAASLYEPSDKSVTLAKLADEVKFGYEWIIKSSAYTATNNDGVLVDTSGLAVTIQCPLTPSEGDKFAISDYTGSFGSNSCTIDRNGSNIMGLAENLILNDTNQGITLVYSDASKGWVIVDATPINVINYSVNTIYITSSQTYNPPSNLIALKLEATGAGGGGGGVDGQGSGTSAVSSGGGAGGTSILSTTNADSSYTIVIGSKGIGGAAGANAGSPGGDTTIVSTSVSITVGGGLGGFPHTGTAGNSGGSGQAGGASSGGDINLTGGYSSSGRVNNGDIGGYSVAGASYIGASDTVALASVTGGSSTVPGTGGASTANSNTTSNYAGGNGSDGIVIITEYLGV